MTARKANKRAAEPKTTAVPDRSNLTLGHEAQTLAMLLRNSGAESGLVPTNMTDAAARQQWIDARRHRLSGVQAWIVDWALAVLEQIPERIDRGQGRAPDPAARAVETLAQGGITKAEAARMVALSEAVRKQQETGKPYSEEEIEDRAEALRRMLKPSRRRGPN